MALLLNPCVEVGVCTERGNDRPINEDTVYANSDLCLYIVADGMGGRVAGEKASATAVEVISHYIGTHLGESAAPEPRLGSRVEPIAGGGRRLFGLRRSRDPRIEKADRDDPIAAVVREAIGHANRRILSLAKASAQLHGMGTTVVMVLVHGSVAYICGVGDSRAYISRDHSLVQLTRDHTLAQALIDQGVLSMKQASRHPYRNVLERYVGWQELGEPEIIVTTLEAADLLILASDGLTGTVSELDITAILEESRNAQQAADRLVEHALRAGSRDNTSCIVIGHPGHC